MQAEQWTDVLLAYGADPEVLEEYDCIPLKARIVRDTLKVRTPSGARALKKVYMSDQRLDYVYQCTEHVAASGLAPVPRFIRNRYGDAYVQHPSGLYYMTTWLPGREVDLRKSTECQAAVRLLGRWQQAAAGFRAKDGWHPETPSFVKRLQSSLAELRTIQTVFRQSEEQTAFGKLFLASAEEIMERVELAIEVLGDVGVEQAQEDAVRRGLLCHGQFTKQNLLFDGDNYSVLHYDSVYPGLPVYDLALLLHRYMPAYEWQPEQVHVLFGTYTEILGGEEDNRERLWALLAAPLRAVQVVSWYYRKAKDWDEEDYVDYLEATLELEEQKEIARESLFGSGVGHRAPAGMVPVSASESPGPDGGATILSGTGRLEHADEGVEHAVANHAKNQLAMELSHTTGTAATDAVLDEGVSVPITVGDQVEMPTEFEDDPPVNQGSRDRRSKPRKTKIADEDDEWTLRIGRRTPRRRGRLIRRPSSPHGERASASKKSFEPSSPGLKLWKKED